MSANGEFVSVLKMDRELITTVSQEFVLQFYTIMNKHPESLHRFYKEESTLIRDDAMAQGQQEIHRYYMKQDLTNCKAIVLSLDAVRSYDKSILIQVTGEIANNNEDLRRFMQSFVLVEQDLGNFYVLNDIFRYQDQTFKVEEVEEVCEEEPVPKEEKQMEINSWGEMSRDVSSDQHIIPDNVIIEEEDRKVEFNNFTEEKEIVSENVESNHEKETSAQEINKLDQESVGNNTGGGMSQNKSWAAVISPLGSGSTSRTNKPTVPVAPQPQVVSKPTPNKMSNGDNFEKRKSNSRYNNQHVPTNNQVGSGVGSIPNKNEGRNMSSYPDEHQLFVGNLPHNMNEKDLRDFFSNNFGEVKDVRIQKSRQTNDGKPLPNFGFLVFSSHDVVADILKNKPIYYNAHRLNVEQKQGNSRSHLNSRR